MKEDIPYSKLIKLALLTTPLFGILGAAPALAMNRTELSRIMSGFLVVLSIALFLWFINILLLKITERISFDGKIWFRYLLSIITCIIVLFFLLQYIFPDNRLLLPKELIGRIPERRFLTGRIMMPLIQALSLNIIVIVLIELVLLKERKQKIETENARLRLINLEAKHSQLKQQLQPHFLFNSLSTLKSLIKKNQDQAEEYLVKLSELLRFSIYADKQGVVSLEKELELCINYLNMQKVRFADALDFTVSVPTAMRMGGNVPVYSIQLLVENAIKHNTLTSQDPLHISINGDMKDSSITISNNIQPKLTIENGNGVGLSNLLERYRLLGNYPVDICKQNGSFIVTIKLLEDENSNY